ncbi:helix-turn-helix transcriptional regulator [Listeria welshimeri]|nr:helix-turn-helix transcriptional regulator [Listeria welshimeri]
MSLIRRKQLSNIAKNIKEYRLKEGTTQKEFADLLEMNYQNYSKMERGVYTPSLEKLLEICDILYITPNDLLLEGREFEDYKKEVFEELNSSIVNMSDTMKIVEEERWALDRIIGIFAWTNEHYWEIADFLYYKRLNKSIREASSNTLEKLVRKMES